MRFMLSVVLLFGLGSQALAIDVDPSKKTVPRKFFDPSGGKGLNLFAGDPKRIERANAVRKDDFELTLVFEPEQLAVPASSKESLPQVRAGLVVRNTSKRPKTLAFNNSQRVDVLVRSAEGKEIYRWSADKMFMQVLGTSMVMPGEKVAFLVDVPLSAWQIRPRPKQQVTFTAVLANYPEFTTTTNIVFAEGSGMPEPPFPSIVSGAQPQAPSPMALPSLAPSLPVPQMQGLSEGFGLAPGNTMPGFSLNPGGGIDGGPAPGVPADPLPKR